MNLFHRRKIIELFIDPSSGRLSMSRTLLPWFMLLDAAWVYAAVRGWPPKEALGPVSSMLGVCTGAICGVYGLSTVKSAFTSFFASKTEGESTIPIRKPNPEGA